MRKFVALALAVLLTGCISETEPSQRVNESRALAAPVNSVSLSDNRHFTFAAVGDLHIGSKDVSRLERILAAAQAEGDAFVVLLGDIVDKGDRDDLVAVRTSLTNGGWDGKVFPVIGNHDVFHQGWTYYKELNGPSVYAFTVGNSKFVVLDTADATLGKDQFDWLETELAQTGAPENLFFLSHYLPVIPGQRTYLKLSNRDEALRLMRMAVEHHVTAWLGGHYHSFITDTIEGMQVVVAGGGGERRMAPVSDYFFVQVTVDGTNVSVQMRKVD